MQLHDPIGFASGDYVELALAAMLVLLAILGRSRIATWGALFAERTIWCMILLAVLPVGLRLALLARHPIPFPDVYDEFGHLLVADTLRHWRLANPPHALPQFFETFFVLQRPTYSSIYPLGQGLMLALGWAVFGQPWAGVLIATAAFCSLCYWMLRGWVSPGWALVGGLIAVIEFGPLNQWMNSYWGGSLTAAAGCLVFGALPRLKVQFRVRDAVLLGLGLGIHLLTRPYESVYLALAVVLFWIPDWRPAWKPLLIAGLCAVPALGLTLLQNKRVTGEWLTLPYAVSQFQYGVPAALTFQKPVAPHNSLTREQDLDYQMQRGFLGGDHETAGLYARRLWYRVRYYRFFFYPPLYVALVFFLARGREYRFFWVALTCVVFALGVNFFPAFQFHYLGAITCLFVLMSVAGLERLDTGAARILVYLCLASFVFWYALHFSDSPALSYETWDAINHQNPVRRRAVASEVAKIPGKILIFVRYWPNHIFQDEWVYNGADIDGSRVVWARDLGEPQDAKLRAYYPDRKVWLLEPDARPPQLSEYTPEPPAPAQVKEPEKPQKDIIPGLRLEPIP